MRGMADQRRRLSASEEENLESMSGLVFMWPLEDGDKLTGVVNSPSA